MILAINQPCFIPWFAYFDLIKNSQKLVFLDTVLSPKSSNSFIFRNRIYYKEKLRWVTFPIDFYNRKKFLNEIEYTNENKIITLNKIVSYTSNDPYYNLMVAICELEFLDKRAGALVRMLKVVDDNPEFKELDFHLGRAYAVNHQFDKGIEIYQRYLSSDGIDDERKSITRQNIIYCQNAKSNIRDSISVEIINIGPDEEFVTINKVAELCSNVTGLNLPPIYKKDRPQEVKHAICSADKARKLLNYKTKISIKEGIQKTYEYIKKRGVKPFEYHINLEIKNELTPDTWTKKEI